MKVVHLVLSDSFAGIEQHVNELLSNELIKNPILITNKSISNNWDWLNSEKQFNLIYEQRQYKVVSVSALTNELAQKKAQEQMPELVWSQGRKNGDWNYLSTSKVETTPEGNFNVDEISDGRVWH